MTSIMQLNVLIKSLLIKPIILNWNKNALIYYDPKTSNKKLIKGKDKFTSSNLISIKSKWVWERERERERSIIEKPWKWGAMIERKSKSN